MKAYRLSVNLKLGLVLFALLIAVASLVYTQWLVGQLRERERFLIGLWARAQEQLAASTPINPHLREWQEIDSLLQKVPGIPEDRRHAYRNAVAWANGMPEGGDIALAGEIVLQQQFGIPAILTDSSSTPTYWQNLDVPQPDSLSMLTGRDSARAHQELREDIRKMADTYPPIPIAIQFGGASLKQYIYYDESLLIKQLRVFPFLQLLFITLFVAIGYVGFSYIRRSEQRSLWVGMAKEAAHQLGTPISSLMGWLELLRIDPSENQLNQALDEIEMDIDRLKRVAGRFSDIGSLPRLESVEVAPVVGETAAYMRRRFPKAGRRVELRVDVPAGNRSPMNVELFEWVIENLIKNALDAMDKQEGLITITGRREEDEMILEVKDNGKGIDRRNWKNIFRPGFSTKKRGWGLGLSLAKRIVEDYHGGSLTLASSRIGQGTTFRITLPATEAPYLSEHEP